LIEVVGGLVGLLGAELAEWVGFQVWSLSGLGRFILTGVR